MSAAKAEEKQAPAPGTYEHVNAHMATWNDLPCPDTGSHPRIIDRDGFIAAKTACRDDTIRGYDTVYGELTRDEKEFLRKRWAAEDEPALVLVSDRPADPGTFIPAPAAELPPGVTGELPAEEAIKQGVDALMAAEEDDPGPDEGATPPQAPGTAGTPRKASAPGPGSPDGEASES
jgi:hypothetical protein